MTPQEQAYAAQVANANNRQLLLATGIPMVKRLQPVIGALGQQVRINLQRMGIMTGVMLHFTVPLAITATATASPVGPWNLAQVVTYTDFAGVNRTQTNGYQLWAGQCMKQSDALGGIPAMSGGTGVAPSMNYNTNILNQPTAISTPTMRFSIYVPMAYNPASDLTGAVLTQTNVGEHYITVQLANALVSADPWAAPYTAGTMTTTGVTVEAYQYYIQPQNMSLDLLPVQDLSTIYGYEGGFKSTQNIAAGMDTFVNYPNNRSILSFMACYENNSVFTLDETDVSQVTLIANSNTNFREMSPRLVRETMRNQINSDLPSGSYYLDHRRQPITTQLYANVQARFSILAANGGITQLVSQYEVMYASGSPLPGIAP